MGAEKTVPQELLTVSPESVCGDLLSGAGIRNAMWLSAFSHSGQRFPISAVGSYLFS